eukprot:5594027-Amphidinium_carterae.1
MPRPSGTIATAWNHGMTWEEQIIEYNRTIVDYLNMNPSFKQAYHKQVIYPIIGSLGGYESKRRSKILSTCLRHGDRVFPTNDSGRYCACDIWNSYHRDYESPQMLIAMTLPLGNDKQRFHWSVSNGTGDWRDYPGRTPELAHSK